MNEPFNLPITYQNTALQFKARLERDGGTHRIAVLIGETTIVFEPDRESGYRALATGVVDQGLLGAIAEKLAALTEPYV